MSPPIASFAEASRQLIGQTLCERPQWNTVANADAIRHFAWGISDDNPLWLEPEYAARGPYGRLAAPPAFLFSVLYPLLHGAPSEVPLTFLISDFDCHWYLPILENDRLSGATVCKDVIETHDRDGRDMVYIVSETTYRNQSQQVVGIINGTIAAISRVQSEMMLERDIHRYSEVEIKALQETLRTEYRAGRNTPCAYAVHPGDRLPVLVRGPLTLGDLISWQAAIGPAYRAAALGLRDLLENPHTATTLPRVGWPVRYSQQHEDFTLTAQRGMPAPFDNSTMRASWLSVLLTNWMGDRGFLKRLQVNTTRPVIYGDTNYYSGEVVSTLHAQNETLVKIRLSGRNQLGELTTSGEAQVVIPGRSHRILETESTSPYIESGKSKIIDWGSDDSGITPKTVCDLFSIQVSAHGQAIAVRAGDNSLTYAELETVSNRLSHALVAKGIGSGSRVGLYFSRSMDLVLGILACVKAGAAYVPLDPEYPTGYLDNTLKICCVDAILSNVEYSGSIDASVATILEFNNLIAESVSLNADCPAVPVGIDDDAYLLLTSGSTGQAKAVTVKHGALGLYLDSISRSLDVDAQDVCLHTAAFSFSASIRQFWLPLCVGAELVIADRESCFRPLQLFTMMRDWQVSVWDTVPSMLEFSVESLQDADEPQRALLLNNALRLVHTTGESLSWKIVHLWRALAPGTVVVNLYSQTETAGTVCTYPITESEDYVDGYVPLGKPVHGIGICLLENGLHPVAHGEIGEICVAGRRLENSYILPGDVNDKKTSALKLADDTVQTVWRSGDLGRYRSDSVLQYVGRIDDQLKIRGFRIDIGEIEQTLMRMPGVEQGVVVSHKQAGENAGIRLHAYVVMGAGVDFDREQLRRYLANWLPVYMMPQGIMQIDALPRNPNGKIDRLALPYIENDKTLDEMSRVMPRNETEELIATIWCQLLGISEVDIGENFFALGGHSLIATRVITRLSDETGVKLSLVEFFDSPTIADLALLLSRT